MTCKTNGLARLKNSGDLDNLGDSMCGENMRKKHIPGESVSTNLEWLIWQFNLWPGRIAKPCWTHWNPDPGHKHTSVCNSIAGGLLSSSASSSSLECKTLGLGIALNPWDVLKMRMEMQSILLTSSNSTTSDVLIAKPASGRSQLVACSIGCSRTAFQHLMFCKNRWPLKPKYSKNIFRPKGLTWLIQPRNVFHGPQVLLCH